MGNATGKLNGAMVCDGGGLAPTGIYAEDAQDYDAKVVQRLILGRQLAPFYTGADEPDPAEPLPGTEDACKAGTIRTSDDGWWSYNLMVAQQAQRSATDAGGDSLDTSSRQMSSAASSSVALHDTADSLGSHPPSPGRRGHVRKGSGFFHRLKVSGHRSPGGSTAEPPKSLSASPTVDSVRHERSMSELSQQLPPVASDAATIDACRRLLRRYVECPICFLYYPQNTNYTRCCHKPICTECFVQIKRKIEEGCIAPTHCPYCVEPNLGVVYYPPGIITGAARTNYMKHRTQLSSNLSHGSPNQMKNMPVPRLLSDTGRARSYTSADSREPTIVMTDDIRPARLRELTAALQAKHREQLRSAENMVLVAAATRRASARQSPETMQSPHSPQFSSLSPPPPLPNRPNMRLFARSPVTATGARQFPPPPTPAAAPEYMAYITAMHAAGHVDLEEFLIQEAIRQSLADQEEAAAATTESDASHSEPATEADTTPTSVSPSDQSDEQITGVIPVVNMLDALDIADHHDQEEATGSTPLVLDESELDAIANVTSRPRLVFPSVSAATSPVLTAVAAAPSPDDLMSFAAVDPFGSDNTAVSSMMTLRSPSSPPGRPRRRPPPPPPPTASHSKQQPHHGADDATQTQPPLILL
ncbi:SNF1-interacting protein [Coemansia pectinata]|uniref:SNF1-interacting protein n=1 Tax=Coemansia pectinata TaxID=1052879 RepID=A0A9W8LAX8_9FUNG|nr:SNF1-interacting protein [Coemansia pectinata]